MPQLVLHVHKKVVADGDAVTLELAFKGHDGQAVSRGIAGQVGGRDLHRVLVLHGGHGVGEGEVADVASVLLPVAGHEVARHQHAAGDDVLIDGVLDDRGASAAHIGGQGLDGDARRLGIQPHGTQLGTGVALSETGQRGVRGTYLELEGAFAQAGVLEGHFHRVLGEVLVEMLAENGVDHVVFTDAHAERAYARGVAHGDGQYACRRYAVRFRADGDDRPVEILEKDVGRGPQCRDDQQHQNRGEKPFFAHDALLVCKIFSLAYFADFFKNGAAAAERSAAAWGGPARPGLVDLYGKICFVSVSCSIQVLHPPFRHALCGWIPSVSAPAWCGSWRRAASGMRPYWRP